MVVVGPPTTRQLIGASSTINEIIAATRLDGVGRIPAPDMEWHRAFGRGVQMKLEGLVRIEAHAGDALVEICVDERELDGAPKFEIKRAISHIRNGARLEMERVGTGVIALQSDVVVTAENKAVRGSEGV